MILYFGTNGRLLETVTEYELASGAKSFITSSGNISSNKIFAYFEGEEPTILQTSVTYILPNGSVFENSSIPADAIVEDSILLDLNRDLTYFKYGKTYRFVEFDLPAALLTTGGEGVYQANFTLYPSTDQARAYGDFSFKAEGSPSQLVENEITDTQYQLILARFSNCVPYTGANANVNLGNYSLTANSVNLRSGIYTCSLDISDSGEPFVSTYHGSSIAWVFSIDETGVKTIATRQWVAAQGFVPYTGATADVNLGIRSLTANQIYLSTSYSDVDYSAWFGIATQPESRRGLVYIYDGTHSRQFNFPNDGDSLQNIATREWADAKYLPLTGGTLSGKLKFLKEDTVNYEWEFGINPYGGYPSTFEIANNVTHHSFIIKQSGSTNSEYIATREWVESNKSIWSHEYTLTGVYHNPLTTIVLKLPYEEEITSLSDLFDAIDLYGYHEKIHSTNTIPTSNTGRYYDLLKGDAAVSGKFYYGTSEIAEMSLLRKTKIL